MGYQLTKEEEDRLFSRWVEQYNVCLEYISYSNLVNRLAKEEG